MWSKAEKTHSGSRRSWESTPSEIELGVTTRRRSCWIAMWTDMNHTWKRVDMKLKHTDQNQLPDIFLWYINITGDKALKLPSVRLSYLKLFSYIRLAAVNSARIPAPVLSPGQPGVGLPADLSAIDEPSQPTLDLLNLHIKELCLWLKMRQPREGLCGER